MERFLQALQYLLPTGFAWPRDPDSVLIRLLSGVAASLDELDALTEAATVAWRPQTTSMRLEEWEQAVGLPDSCFGSSQSVAARRARLMSRLRGASGYYSDSSPTSLDAIESICGNLGYPAQAHYNIPFRCGRDRVGRRLGQLDGQLHLILTASSEPFRVGRDRVGQRLAARPVGAVELACYLEQYLPARFALVVNFSN